MKAAIVGDLHVIDERLDGQRAILETVGDQIVSADPEVILIVGDLTGQTVPHKATPRERNTIVEFVVKIAGAAPVIIVRGNHDYLGDFTFLNSLKAPNDVFYVEETPEAIQVGGGMVMAFPWIDRSAVANTDDYSGGVREIYAAAIDACAEDLRRTIAAGDRTIAVGHVAFAEGSIVDGQPTVPTSDPVLPIASIMRPGLFSAGFFGHYHDPQSWKSIDAHYCGSIFVSSFGEPAAKSWVLHDAGRTKRIPIDQPPKIVVEFDPVTRAIAAVRPKIGEVSIAGVRDYLDAHPGYLRLVPQYHEEDAAKAAGGIAAVRAEIAGSKTLAVRIEPDVVRLARVREGSTEVAQARSLTDKIDAYLESLDSKPNKEIRTRMHQILAEIETEVDGEA